MGIRGSLTSEVLLKNCRIPKENLLGGEGQGFKIAMMTLDGGRMGIAAQALGIAQAALDESIKYSKERVQFGKPISSLQPIQWMIANMVSEVEASRFLTYHAAWCCDQGSLTAVRPPWQSYLLPKRLPVKRTALYRSMGVSVTSREPKSSVCTGMPRLRKSTRGPRK